jgi:tRNA1(Val) A37 N6-methylase TrmN6
MTTASSTPSDTTPADIEFALLQSWLASSSALQLPLHHIESQQQAKGREVQRLLLQAHLQHRGNGDVGPALCLHGSSGDLSYSHRRLGARSLTTVGCAT